MTDIIPIRGPLPAPLTLELIRELTPTDLLDLVNLPAQPPAPLKKLRAQHHRIAQLLAQGRTSSEVAAIVGMTPQRVRDLQNHDPAFGELITYYHEQLIVSDLEDAARLRDKITDLGEMAVDEMRERLEDDERRKALPMGELRQISQFAMDRTVAPPKSTQPQTLTPTQITLNIGNAQVIEGDAPIDITPKTKD